MFIIRNNNRITFSIIYICISLSDKKKAYDRLVHQLILVRLYNYYNLDAYGWQFLKMLLKNNFIFVKDNYLFTGKTKVTIGSGQGKTNSTNIYNAQENIEAEEIEKTNQGIKIPLFKEHLNNDLSDPLNN